MKTILRILLLILFATSAYAGTQITQRMLAVIAAKNAVEAPAASDGMHIGAWQSAGGSSTGSMNIGAYQ